MRKSTKNTLPFLCFSVLLFLSLIFSSCAPIIEGAGGYGSGGGSSGESSSSGGSSGGGSSSSGGGSSSSSGGPFFTLKITASNESSASLRASVTYEPVVTWKTEQGFRSAVKEFSVRVGNEAPQTVSLGSSVTSRTSYAVGSEVTVSYTAYGDVKFTASDGSSKTRREVIASESKTVRVAAQGTTVNFKVSEGLQTPGSFTDESAEPEPKPEPEPAPAPPPPATEYVNITFNQGFVYTNTVHQSPNTWQAMTGATLPNGIQREKGSSVSADQATATGYVFKGWVENSQSPSGGAPNTQSFNYVQNYNSDMTLYGIWEQIEPGNHSVKFAGGTTTGSSVSGLPQDFQQKESTQATFSGTPTCPGYEFAGWSADVAGVTVTQQGNGWEFTMPTSDVTLTAQWNVITYTVSYESGIQGTSPQIETFTLATGGTNVTLKAANTFTRTGYTLSQWNAGNNNWSPSTDVAKTSLVTLATGNGTNRTITITAVWTPIQYKITYSNTNGGTGNADTANATTSFNIETQSITLAAVGTLEKIAYQFAGWETSDGTNTDVSNMNAAELIALITSGATLALQVKWEVYYKTDKSTWTVGDIVLATTPNVGSAVAIHKNAYAARDVGYGDGVAVVYKNDSVAGKVYIVGKDHERKAWAAKDNLGYANKIVALVTDITTNIPYGGLGFDDVLEFDVNSYIDGSTGLSELLKIATNINGKDDDAFSTQYPAWDFACNYSKYRVIQARDLTGWYFPSLAEIFDIWKVKSSLESVLTTIGGSNFGDNTYWCSSQYSLDSPDYDDSTDARTYLFSDSSTPGSDRKDSASTNYVCAVLSLSY